MTTTIVFAGASDGGVFSFHANFAIAQGGAGGPDVVTSDPITYGQQYTAPNYYLNEGFLEFAYTKDTAAMVVSANFAFWSYDQTTTSIARDLEIREYDWGGTVSSGDYRTPAALAGLTWLGTVPNVHQSAGQFIRAGAPNLLTRLDTTGTVRVILHTSRQRVGNTPTTTEYGQITSADYAGTTYDPRMEYTTVPLSTMNRVLGSQVQLSDGTHVFIEAQAAEAALGASSLKLRYHNGTSATDIATLTVNTGTGGSVAWPLNQRGGMQSYGLCRDADDNLYVIGRKTATGTAATVQAFIKGGGMSWTAGTRMTASLSSYDSWFDGYVCAWHSRGGTAGTIVAVATAPAGGGQSNQTQVLLLNCDTLLAGSGTVLRGTAGFADLFIDYGTGYTYFHNETLTAADIAADPGSADRGYVICRNGDDSVYGDPVVTRYTLNAGGTGFSSVARTEHSMGSTSRDANDKLRVVGIDSTRYAVAGGTRAFTVFQNIGASSSVTMLGSETLADVGTATLPATLNGSATWDLAYDAADSKLWLYHLDTADNRRLVRTSFDLNTMLPAQDTEEISAAVGAVGSTNYAIRVDRGSLTGSRVLVAVANKTSGGTHSTVYVTDLFNQPPNAPTLNTKSNFDATGAATFTWTFNDPNASDTQSAYQIDINTSGGTDTYDSGKTTSTSSQHVLTAATLTNPGDWQWRVKTWDAADEAGAWSAYSTFSTAAGGTVTITDPASDNPAGVITDNYVVAWSVAGSTQAAYRVQVERTDTAASLLDTGWVTSADTDFDVTGMLSDVEYEITVRARNGAAVETNADTVLITPSYGTPEVPEITVTAVDDGGYILIDVSNPEPDGDRPEVTSNEVYRRVVGDDDYGLIGTCDPDGEYRDYAAASGVAYEYKVRGVAP